MVKIYKQNNKLILYIPQDVIKSLNLDENEEVEFFRYNNKSFIIAKKSDLSNMLLEKNEEKAGTKYQFVQKTQESSQLSDEEIAVLKKLDTLRYNMRTKANVDSLLSSSEKATLSLLLKKKAVNVFQGDKSKEPLYGISKVIYDKFLMRKKPAMQQPAKQGARESKIHLKRKSIDQNLNVEKLEDDGFLILQTEAEASSLSLDLEESIRQGLVIGTRAFNRKFYIVLRSFIEKNSGNIIKAIRSGTNKVPDIARETGLEEDGTRAILYLLSENGDVSEKKRDYFVMA